LFKKYLKSTITKDYIDPLPINVPDSDSYRKIISKKEYIYSHPGIISTEYSSTEGVDEQTAKKYFYPSDISTFVLSDDPSENVYYKNNYKKMNQFHILSKPVQVETDIGIPVEITPDNNIGASKGLAGFNKISTKRTLYNDKLMPDKIQISKGEFPLEDKVHFTKYDNYENILEYKLENDMPVSVIWAYNHNFPVAKIKSVPYDEEYMNGLSEQIQDIRDDEQMRTKLSVLQNKYPDALITTFTYEPVFGMTSQTDSNGKTTYYEYDGFGRLKRIKDQDGNIIKAYEYNYKKN